MPRAIEIRVDPILKCVVIDTNFPNREVTGAGWEPQLFRLGWDSPEEIWDAMHDVVPTLICYSLQLRDSYDYHADILTQAFDETDTIIESALKNSESIFETMDRVMPLKSRYIMPVMADRRIS